MKQQFCQLLIFLLIFFAHDSHSTDTHEALWGYMVHTDIQQYAYRPDIMDRFSVICFTGFMLHDDGRISTPPGPTLNIIKKLSLKRNVAIYPLISFASAHAGRKILSDASCRKKAVHSIASMSAKHEFCGIHLDFEYLPPEYARLLGLFLDELRKEYHGAITMAVFPGIGFPGKWSGFHDLSIIAPRVDGMVLMCYDLNGSHTGPGPVTDVKWAEKNIVYALRHCKPGRLWLGVPAYGYRWCGGTATALSSKQGVKLAARNNARRDPSGTLVYKTANSCLTYISDRKTRSLLAHIAAQYGLAGIAIWRIGFED